MIVLCYSSHLNNIFNSNAKHFSILTMPRHFKGGLFDSETDDAELVFQYAIEAVNNEYSDDLQRQFEAQTVKLKFGNEFQVSQKLCRLLKVYPWNMPCVRFEAHLTVSYWISVWSGSNFWSHITDVLLTCPEYLWCQGNASHRGAMVCRCQSPSDQSPSASENHWEIISRFDWGIPLEEFHCHLWIRLV